jgi:predicted lipoprotein with Yx(FWY)xxD motif
MPILLALVAAIVTLAAVTGTGASPQATEAAGAAARPATLTVRSSDYGRVLFDGRGRALYAFTSDGRGPSTCFGACATAWPPYTVTGRLRAGRGVRAALLGTVRRPDGSRQVTYNGRPLYYYVGDRQPGQILCQDVFEFGGTWLVVRPNGTLVR